MTVILINPHEVPEDKEAEFLKGWGEVVDILRKEPGYISTKLYRSLDPKARFRFINAGEWESQSLFAKAMVKAATARPVSFRSVSAHANPALYRVVKADLVPGSGR